ncbi:MAG: PspC domain-containing protein [Candidatus Doudnabacteria bacterium]|nr:PspC domain-containing protein [Candidatus Doudnabacteria bacterium]
MIYRNIEKSYIAGVASGIAEHYQVPVSLVRGLFVVTSFFLGLGVLVYMYLILITDSDTGQTHLNFQ